MLTVPARNAGPSPKSKLVNSETANENHSTRLFIRISEVDGNTDGKTERAACVYQDASNTPSAPPARDKSTLSVNNCRTIRPRRAPNAVRIPNSCVRVAERARNRFATLVQAISNTKTTATLKARSTGR